MKMAVGKSQIGQGWRASHRLSIAPMLDWTNRYFRRFFREISKQAMLYTEMMTTAALLHGDRDKLLAYSSIEKPLALQLGGEDPHKLAECSRIAADWGYDEINLNVGCPSDRVQSGRFGVCLMAESQRVAAAVAAMKKAVAIPVTVKHRLGIADSYRFEQLGEFVRMVSSSGCDRFIVHARVAFLHGLSPAENRCIPPLRYSDVYRLKADFPHLSIDLNGGVTGLEQVIEHLDWLDGVMVGRAAYRDPYAFILADQLVFGATNPPASRGSIVQNMADHLSAQPSGACFSSHAAIRPMLGLFKGQPAARIWRRAISEGLQHGEDPARLLLDSLTKLPQEVCKAAPPLPDLANDERL